MHDKCGRRWCQKRVLTLCGEPLSTVRHSKIRKCRRKERSPLHTGHDWARPFDAVSHTVLAAGLANEKKPTSICYYNKTDSSDSNGALPKLRVLTGEQLLTGYEAVRVAAGKAEREQSTRVRRFRARAEELEVICSAATVWKIVIPCLAKAGTSKLCVDVRRPRTSRTIQLYSFR